MPDQFLTLKNFLIALRSVPLWQVALELLVIGGVVYWVIRFLQGTRGARLLKGIIFLLITLYLGVRLLEAVADLERLAILFNQFLFYASLAIIIVFQPELRRALMRLGETRLFRRLGGAHQVHDEIEQIVDAAATLSRRRVGALIALEREVALGGFTEEATRIDGQVTSALIQTIFWPNTALHDLGMIISNGKIAWAGVQFPLAESGDLPRELGSRHRAAVGLTQESDAIVIVVSEETGDISIAERGQLLRRRTVEQLRQDLQDRLGHALDGSAFEETDVRQALGLASGGTRLSERSPTRVTDSPTRVTDSQTRMFDAPGGSRAVSRAAQEGRRPDSASRPRNEPPAAPASGTAALPAAAVATVGGRESQTVSIVPSAAPSAPPRRDSTMAPTGGTSSGNGAAPPAPRGPEPEEQSLSAEERRALEQVDLR